MKYFLITLLVITGLSCAKKLKISDVPKISFISLTPNQVKAGSSEDSTRIKIYFEDGNGDIGFKTNNLYLKDSRDGNIIPFQIPEIPSEYSPNLGMKGMITIDYRAASIYLRADTSHLNADTLAWEIYMIDQAGNKSNTITTDSLYLSK